MSLIQPIKYLYISVLPYRVQHISVDHHSQQAPGAAQDGPRQHIARVMRPHIHASDAYQQRGRVQQEPYPHVGMEMRGHQRRQEESLAGMPARKRPPAGPVAHNARLSHTYKRP